MAMQEVLIVRIDTTHAATSVSPYQAMNSRTIRKTRLHIICLGRTKPTGFNQRDEQYKAKMKNNAPAKVPS